VRVSLRDGSGREVESLLDRGDTKRSRLEKKLDQLSRRRSDPSTLLEGSAEIEFDDAYSEATRALTDGKVDEPERGIQHMEHALTRTAGGGESLPTWKRRAEGLMGYTEFIISEYGWLLDPSTTVQLKDLVNALRGAVARDNQAEGERYTQQLDKATDEVPGILRNLMLLVQAGVAAHKQNDDISADKIREAKSQVEAAVRRNDRPAAEAAFNGIMPVLEKVLSRSREPGKPEGPGKEDVLGR
jgi:hypothetical protein